MEARSERVIPIAGIFDGWSYRTHGQFELREAIDEIWVAVVQASAAFRIGFEPQAT